ncbi:MAG: hypothetical protein JSW07_02870 [bacterium]|nr:MAG: hypothetical protein JSW07_02870 [bacterium]
MHTRRNSITIGVLWLALMVIGVFGYKKGTGKIKDLKIKNKELTQQLDGSLEIIKTLNTVENQYSLLKQNWEQFPKKIIATNEPSFSLYYLSWLTKKYDVSLGFDFELNSINDDGDIKTFKFTLSGEGSYHGIYRLISLLTENPLLYQIESFSLQTKKDNDLLNFNMQIKGFSLNPKWESGQEFTFDSMEPVAEASFFHDAFKPLRTRLEQKPRTNMSRTKVSKPKPKRKEEELIDVHQTTLQAVANGKVYLKDKSGKLITLKAGDKVHMGSLRTINQKKSEVEFILDQQGDTKKVTLGLGYKK